MIVKEHGIFIQKLTKIGRHNIMNYWKDIQEIKSSDENVSKFVFKTGDAVAESVLYKYPTYEERTVICCSTQSGCPVGCRFCGAGDHFVRSLTAGEIYSQPVHLLTQTGVNPSKINKLQIMFMSMGEPLYNIDSLIEAMILLNATYPNAKLLVSTSAPRNYTAFEKLNNISKQIDNIGLQFSVHESTNEARRKLIPSQTMDLEEISKYGVAWSHVTGRRPFFNYCVHDNNNTQDDVNRLVELFGPEIWESTISVICERQESIAAANKRQRELAQNFSNLMLQSGYNVRVFNPAGQDDIGGGCGQLWYVQSWMKNNPDKVKHSRGFGLPVIHTPKNSEKELAS